MSPTLYSPRSFASLWLATALLALPWLYRIPWDTPKAVALVLLGPALWFGRASLAAAFQKPSRKESTEWLAAGLVVSVLCSTAMSTHWAASLTTVATWCLLALTAVLVNQLVSENPRSSILLLGALALSPALGTVAHAICWINGAPPESAFYLHHRLMGLHAFSGALVAAGMLLWAWPRSAGIRVVWTAIGAVTWAGLLWTGSRSPLVGIALALLVWSFKLDWRERAKLMLAVAVLCLAGMAISALGWSEKSHLGWWHLWHRSAADPSPSGLTSHRSDFWAEGFAHVKEAPWFGHGPDAYGFLTPQLEGAQPHNLLLQLLLDLGAPAAAAVLLLIGSCLLRGWINPTKNPTDLTWLALAIGSVTAAQLDGYFYYPLACLPAAVALGGCTARRAKEMPSTSDARTSPRSLLSHFWPWLASGAGVILLLHCWLYFQVIHRPAPESPNTWVARAWRIFPSTTFNIDEWVEHWATRYPDDALATSRCARLHSQTPEIFRVKTARLLARRGQLSEAIAELELARAESRPEQHPPIDALLSRMRSAVEPH